MQPSPPPFRPLATFGHDRITPTGPTVALRVAMVALAVVIIFVLTTAGLLAGLMWSFGACFKQQCSDVDAAAVVLLPIVGLVAGLGAAVWLRVKRAWFYRHPLVVWVPVALAGAWLAMSTVRQISM